MATLVLLISTGQDEVALGASNVEALARLGVSTVSLARDEHTAAVILEGWALDPDCADAALSALGTSPDRTRALQPVVQMAVSAAPNHIGGTSR
jgi:cyanophycinase-like exopeptidase